jgi:hypothetical protein
MDIESLVYEILALLEEDSVSSDREVQKSHLKSRIWDLIAEEVEDLETELDELRLNAGIREGIISALNEEVYELQKQSEEE